MKKSVIVLAFLAVVALQVFAKHEVGVFCDKGPAGIGAYQWFNLVNDSPDINLTLVDGSDIRSGALDKLEMLVMPGGSSRNEYLSLKDEGMEKIRSFIRNGGGYIGTCAGCFLACDQDRGEGKRMHIVPVLYKEPPNGTIFLRHKLTPQGKAALGISNDTWSVRFHGGTVMKPSTNTIEGAKFEVWAKYASDADSTAPVTKKNSVSGYDAILGGTYGKGRVVVFGAHPEYFVGTVGLVDAAFRWVLQDPRVKTVRRYRKPASRPIAFVQGGMKDGAKAAVALHSSDLYDVLPIDKDTIHFNELEHVDLVVFAGGTNRFSSAKSNEILDDFLKNGGKVLAHRSGADILQEVADALKDVVDVKVDFSVEEGKIRPLHGVNNAPMRFNGEKQWELEEAGIPFVRTHDTGGAWGGTHYVDVPNIFPNFDADENDPSNYDFAFTDAWLKTVVRAKAKVFYRLGVTIENHWRIKSYNIYPPKDPAKWARICEHIVRHYNEGWAKGYKYGIEYWEIWNEPENPPMWKGSREQFFELYRVAANHLKACFPNLKVGGYGSCGFYAIDAEKGKADPFDQSFVDWYDAFLKYVTNPQTKAPLDFYSWHVYASATPEIITRHAKYVREKLDAAGLKTTESILDEWNRVGESWDDFENMKTSVGAACVAEAFCRLQRAGVDKAMYYDAFPKRAYCGILNLGKRESRTTTYHTFRFWNRLYRLGIACRAVADGGEHFSVMAAKDDNDGKAILLVNDTPETQRVNLSITAGNNAKFLVYRLDDVNDALACEVINLAETIVLPPYGLAMLATKEIVGRKSPQRKAATFAGQDRK